MGSMGGFERAGVRVCNGVCNGFGHNVAQPGTDWHNLAQVAGGRMGLVTGRNLWGLLNAGRDFGGAEAGDVGACGPK